MITNPVLPITLHENVRDDAPTPENAVTRWDIFIGYLASGKPIEEAMVKARVNRATIETMCRMPGGIERQRFNDARLAGWKTTLSALSIEHFFNRIAQGDTVAQACVSAWGGPQAQIYDLLNSDPDMALQYKRAQEAAMIREFDEIKAIADDTSRDVLQGPKGEIPNNAAVGRDKLRTDARFRRAGILNRRVFGEDRQVAVQVNVDFVKTLEDARAREKNRGPVKLTKAEKAAAVDAKFEDTSWMDEKPTDMIWKEES